MATKKAVRRRRAPFRRPPPAWYESAIAWHASTVAILAMASVLIFSLPWRMPVRSGVESDSVTFGFSNAAATLAVAATLVVLFLRRLLLPRIATATGDRFLTLVVPRSRALPLEQFVLACGIAVSWSVVIGWWSLSPSAYFGESAYFLTRLDMMTLGKLPYRDFDYGYGPALLWLPFLIHRAAGGLLAIDTAYIITLLLHFALGLLATASILRRLALEPRQRIAILVFVALSTLNIMLGVIYTPLRFLYALWGILLFDAAQRWGSNRAGWLAAFLVPLGGMLLSPEVGVVSVIACLTWLATAAWCGKTSFAPRATAIVAAALIFWGLFGAEMLRFIAVFGGGAFNFPLIPTPYAICLLGLAFGLLPAMAAAGIHVASDASPILVSLVVTLGMFLPAAFGRCDPAHVLFNGLGLIVIGLAANASPARRWQGAATALAATVIVGTYAASTWNFVGPDVSRSLGYRKLIKENRAELESIDARVLREIVNRDARFDWGKRLPFAADLTELLRYETIGTPLTCHEDVERFLKITGRYVPAYHVPPYGGATNIADVERRVAEALGNEILLVPGWFTDVHEPQDREILRQRAELFLGTLIVWPLHLPKPVREAWNADVTTLQRLSRDYSPEGRFRDLLILRRNRTP